MGMPGEKYTGAVHGRPAKPEREIMIYLPNKDRRKKGLFVEFKGGGSPDLVRSKWLKYVKTAGYRVFTCHTLEDLEEVLATIIGEKS